MWTAVAMALLAASGWAQGMYSGAGGIMAPSANVKPPGLKNVGIEQKLNQSLPLESIFRDETGKTVKAQTIEAQTASGPLSGSA